ncbi:hypothetical protein N824_28515 [Pedobacter sp. V48]|nr:hypothetical protein N824_28515 [Pedobacter sp. V48]
MHTHEWSCRIKSVRQKKRLVKTDRDKQLIKLDQLRAELWQQKRLLPLVSLEHPYQRGWKRFFVLQEDLKHSPRIAFYETLLAKINTVEYHYDKSFKRKRRRIKRYEYEVKQQLLREFSTYSWHANNVNLTDDEKACFTCVETFDVKARCTDVKYVFTEPWRYRLKVTPHMVTHVKLMDVDIERELSFINNHIDNHNLEPRINLLTRGRGYHWGGWFYERDKYINKIKNISRYSPKEAYLELET